MPDADVFSKLDGSVGRFSRYAGLGFIGLSIFFLVLAVSDQFVVFEIDSIVAFLAAIILLFKDKRARVQTRVLDAVLQSADQAIGELSTSSDAGFTYIPTGSGVEKVVIVPERLEKLALPDGGRTSAPSVEITPPGRGLAKLYVREMGLTQITIDALQASLSDAIRENFGLAGTVEIVSTDARVSITLHGSSTTCTCGTDQANSASNGYIGCTVASFLAVLVSAATKRAVSLERCMRDASTDTWTISMGLGPSIPVII